MVRIDIITVLPQLLEGPFSHSIIKRGCDKGLIEVQLHNLRDFATNKYKSVDDYAFGGQAGMVMMCEPIANCIEKLQGERTYSEVIYLTPDGTSFTQRTANQLSLCDNIMLLCGHYKGVDERIREKYITMEISIGDYVISGGELAAAVVADAILRLVPGVMNDETSALSDSFQDDLLSPPVYTRPAEWRGMAVPSVLLSGHERQIADWKHAQALARTAARRPDLFDKFHK